METKSRLVNSSKNILTGVFNQVITLILSFVSRTIFIRVLGEEYLGVNGLFSNVLMVLSLADLGFGTAIVYSMYKPIIDKDTSKIAALMNFYKKIYNYVAIFVTVLGLALVPFLKYLINMENALPHVTLYYLLYLANTVLSYLFVYKTSIVIAHQQSYLLNIYDSAFVVIQYLAQILMLIFTKNFTAYLIVQLLCTFLRNLYKANKSEKLYPYIKNNLELDKETKKDILTNVKSMFVYKIGGVILNNTENIIISILIGTVAVGYYSNYKLLIASVTTFTTIIFSSISASVGNLNAQGDTEQKFFVFRVLDFVGFWIFSFCSVCFLVLINDFIYLWLGEQYLLSNVVVIAIIINFYIPGIMQSIWTFRDTTGLFRQTKYVSLFTSAINLILAVILGKIFGLAGIFFAAAIARVLSNFWYEPLVLHRDYFGKSTTSFFFNQGIRIVLTALSTVIIVLLSSFMKVTWISFIYKMVLCLIVPNVIYIILFRKTEEFQYIYKKVVKNVVDKIYKKIKGVQK